MTEPASDRPPAHRRRPRYRGTHPRHFEEKYKERAPDKYPELVAHVRERGQTPAGQHVAIMVEQVLAALDVRAGERGVDATLGWGGHAQRLLERLGPEGQLLALDADPIELERTSARLRGLGLARRLAPAHDPPGCAALDSRLVRRSHSVFAELGLSSRSTIRARLRQFHGPLTCA